MIVAGLGFRHGISFEEILDLVRLALSEAALSSSALNALATTALRADEPGFRQAADRLNLPGRGVDPGLMRRMEPRLETRSPRIAGLHGVGSVAEAAALAAAGEPSRLILPRIASARVTCALAQGQIPRQTQGQTS